MERFTRRVPGGYSLTCGGQLGTPRNNKAVIDRLAAYENTELEPSEIEQQLMNFASFLSEMTHGHMSKTNYTMEAMLSEANDCFERICDECADREELAAFKKLGSLDHLRDLVQAEKEGRLAVLPCKASDKLYVCGEKQIVECDIYEVYLDDKRGVEYLVSYECNMDCDGCPFNDWKQDFEGEYSCDGEYCQAAVFASDFGKTVFLTREEAESAVKRRTEDCASAEYQV